MTPPVSTPPARAFAEFLETVRAPIDEALDRHLPPAGDRFHEAMRYSVFAGGKRVRPALVLAAGEHLGVARSTLLPAAVAVELIHTYSLVHDDLPALDDDDLRRGRPTVHRRFDEATAILVGDALLTLGLTLLAAEPRDAPAEARRAATEAVGRAIGSLGMIGGQVDDLEAERRWPDDPAAALAAIHRRKTGELLAVCLRLPGIYARVDAATDRRLGELGAAVGLLFQIADDILDVEGTAGTLGKTAGKDAAARKLTYPGLFGLARAKELLAETRDRALALAEELTAAPRPAASGDHGGGADGGLFPSLIHFLTERDR